MVVDYSDIYATEVLHVSTSTNVLAEMLHEKLWGVWKDN